MESKIKDEYSQAAATRKVLRPLKLHFEVLKSLKLWLVEFEVESKKSIDRYI